MATVPQRYRRTDGQHTDGRLSLAIPRNAHIVSHGNKSETFLWTTMYNVSGKNGPPKQNAVTRTIYNTIQ